MDILMWHKILSPYEMAVDELILKFDSLRREFQEQGQYCPIEHVTGRVKSISSILDKMAKKKIPPDQMEEQVEDIAGIRIICQFTEDISRVADLITARTDIELVEIKDYIRNKKQSGYRSYHMVVRYEVNTIQGPKKILVEIQIRTMAMDFWATTEHSLQYKYKGKIPERVGTRLSNAANAIISLDNEMSSVRDEIMDAQLSSKLRYNLVEDIVNTIESLYRLTSKREVEKIQDEFYRIYQSGDIEELVRYHRQLDLIAEAYHAQRNRVDEGIKISEE
ncbi:MAG: GTP pyrophosphokinase family protein [Eubacterium sp.]|nr:GTP pyrophosphokinase family protein [Eubacterium sp.]